MYVCEHMREWTCMEIGQRLHAHVCSEMMAGKVVCVCAEVMAIEAIDLGKT